MTDTFPGSDRPRAPVIVFGNRVGDLSFEGRAFRVALAGLRTGAHRARSDARERGSESKPAHA